MSIKILYWGRDWEASRPGEPQIKDGEFPNIRKLKMETHPYAQLEICVRGHISVIVENQISRLETGDCLLIPPGIAHYCLYPDSDNEFYSLKFECDSLPKHVFLFPASDLTNWFLAGMRICHSAEQRFAMPLNDSNREILEGIIEMFLTNMRRTSMMQARESEPPVFNVIRDLVMRSGTFINAAECAEMLGLDASQLNYRFAKELKEFGLSFRDYSVKKVIDTAVLYQINKYLDFTELTISEIAKQMKFNNIYTFSRFYHRLQGYSPRERRLKKSSHTI